MNPTIWDWVKTLLPIAAAVGVVFLGAWLTHWRERKHWLNDCRKEEYKELLNILTKATIALIQRFDPANGPVGYWRPEKTWEPQDFYMRTLEVMRDRIYISDELKAMDIYDRWTEAMKALTITKDFEHFEITTQGIHRDLVEAAKRPV